MFGSTSIQFPWTDSAELVVLGGSPSAQPTDFPVAQLPDCGGETWMVVDASARELWLDTSGGTTTIPSLTDLNQAPRTSSVWLRITWHVGGASHSITLDLAGGGRYAVFGSKCEAFIVGPPGSQLFTPNGSEIALAGTRVGFCTASVALSRSPTPYGDRHGRLSQRVQVARMDSTRETSIPPAAGELQIFEGGTPSNAAWQWVAGGPTGTPYGPINLTAGASERVFVPGFARSVTQPTPAGADRNYAFVYRIEW